MAGPLGIPAYRALFASALVAGLGGSIADVAVNWVVFHYTQNALDISLLGLTGFGPSIALGLFAGVVADRYNRRSIMVSADVARFALMGSLTVAFWLWGFSLPVILLVMVFVNSFGTLFTPASQAIVARLVPRESLENATGLLQSTSSSVNTIGSALGGIVVATLGALWGLGTNALTFGLSAVFLFQIATEFGSPKRIGPKPKRSFRTDFSDGMSYVLKNKLLPVTFGYLPINLLGSLVLPFMVVYASDRFGGSALVYGGLAAASAAGVALGALLPGRFSIRRYAGGAMGLCVILGGGFTIVLALTHNVLLAVLAALGGGLEVGFQNTVFYATIQAVVPEEVLGRVMSLSDFGSFAAIPAGLVLGGFLIDRIGVGAEFFYAAVGIILCAIVLLSLPSFRTFGRERLSSPS